MRAEPQHYHIRQQEKALFESQLLSDRCTWLIYDWGLAKNSFIACVSERFSKNGQFDVFRFLCDNIDNSEEIELHFKNQFSLTIQEFCIYTSKNDNCILVIDEISPKLIKTDSQSIKIFNRIISSILEFSEKISIIIASRQKPHNSPFKDIQLLPLNPGDVKNYIINHPKSSNQSISTSFIEELYMRSEGLPMHLDRLIETLQVTSLKDIADIEHDTPLDGIASLEPVPKALKQAVAFLSTSNNEYTRRGFSMLKVLSVLPEGETLHSIKRLYQTKPFYPRNAIELMDLSLLTIDMSDANSVKLTNELSKLQEDKYLCVPRQVRDYVNSIMTNEERSETVRCLANLLFGNKWREGKIKILHTKNKGIISAETGNEHSVIRYMLRDAIRNDDTVEIKIILILAISYCLHLKNHDRFNDVCIAADEYIYLIENFDFNEQYAELAIIYGKSLRMISERDLSILTLNKALEIGEGLLSNSNLAEIHLNIALAHQSKRNKVEAIKSANKAQILTNSDSSIYMQAESIKLYFKSDPERTTKLTILMNKARNKKYNVVANNIALDLCDKTSDQTKKLSSLSEVLSITDDPYNRIRAIIKKVMILSKDNKINLLNDSERQLLNFAYSFLYSQRITNLFTKCHEAIWCILKSESNLKTLLSAFKLSSFLWRIRGEESVEKKYLQDIKNINLDDVKRLNDENVKIDISYLDRRLDQMLSSS